jgi:transcriptional regulator with XRE-family HTH domain
MSRLADLKKRLMEDPAFAEECRKVDAEFAVVERMIRARTDACLSQADVARALGTTQSSIARLEGGAVSPSLRTLRKYAEATGTDLEVAFRPRRREAAPGG